MRSTLKILIILTILSQNKVVAEEDVDEKLGFLLKDKLIKVSKSIEILKVGLLVPGSKEFSHYKPILEEIVAAINKVDTMKLLEEESKYETQIHILTTQTDKEKRNISLHACIFKYPAISIDKLQGKLEEIQYTPSHKYVLGRILRNEVQNSETR